MECLGSIPVNLCSPLSACFLSACLLFLCICSVCICICAYVLHVTWMTEKGPCRQSVRKQPIHNNFLCDVFLFHVVTCLTWGIGKWVAYWMWRGCSYSWGKAGSMPFSLQLALLSCSGAGFSGEGLPLDSQCIGGENICQGKMRQKWPHPRTQIWKWAALHGRGD